MVKTPRTDIGLLDSKKKDIKRKLDFLKEPTSHIDRYLRKSKKIELSINKTGVTTSCKKTYI